MEAIAFANKVTAITKNLKKDAARYNAEWPLSSIETLEEEAYALIKSISSQYSSRYLTSMFKSNERDKQNN